ncbi:hypothetical protein [Clostridium intestinale]|uniref:Uncharacterized protein n=1 Tax=Clostridium intestinale TaxID=36845 RepID=A0A7D6ZRA2_9CLOT|nr:hypothetical protein [Clostridium intestinale]QLY77833.1 hypothetical protein HZF06_12000 [Clostridium intestinale]
MKKIEVQIPDFLKGKLIKDLQDDEVICEHCNGTGLGINDNRYGIQGEYSRTPFPYTHQSIGFCRHCYNGIQHKCIHCGKILDRSSRKCDCDGYKKEQQEEEEIKLNEAIKNAKKIKFADYEGYLVIDERVMDKEDFEDCLYCKIQSGDEYPIFMFGTERTHVMAINFSEIISDSCEDGYEDMSDTLDYQGVEEIQTLIDQWIEKQGDRNYCYYENNKIIVLLDDLIAELKEDTE